MLRSRFEWKLEQLKETLDVVILVSLNTAQSLRSAAMLVPSGQERDWIFASENGQLQLLNMTGVSKFYLLSREELTEEGLAIGEEWNLADKHENDETLKKFLRLVLAELDGEDVPLVSYEDGVTWRKTVDKVTSRITGTMLVEDVRLESGCLRRRLRFKEMPNLIQTEVALLADEHGQCTGIDHTVLVHVYLAPLVAGLSLVSWTLEDCIASSGVPRVLCIGVGGGALPMFLSRNMEELHVEAVDLDSVVVDVARRQFGLVEGRNLQVRAEDGLAAVEKMAKEGTYVQAIFVDVSAGDGLSCPPPAFTDEVFLAHARALLDSGGVLAMNIMPGARSSHQELTREISTLFEEVYEIEVNDGENFAVFALPHVSRQPDGTSSLLRKLRRLVGDELINNIRKVA